MRRMTIAGLTAMAAMLGANVVLAETKPNPIEADGTVNVPGFRLPPSTYLSEEARKSLPRRPVDASADPAACGRDYPCSIRSIQLSSGQKTTKSH